MRPFTKSFSSPDYVFVILDHALVGWICDGNLLCMFPHKMHYGELSLNNKIHIHIAVPKLAYECLKMFIYFLLQDAFSAFDEDADLAVSDHPILILFYYMVFTAYDSTSFNQIRIVLSNECLCKDVL